MKLNNFLRIAVAGTAGMGTAQLLLGLPITSVSGFTVFITIFLVVSIAWQQTLRKNDGEKR
jgi:heme A synthase